MTSNKVSLKDIKMQMGQISSQLAEIRSKSSQLNDEHRADFTELMDRIDKNNTNIQQVVTHMEQAGEKDQQKMRVHYDQLLTDLNDDFRRAVKYFPK